jgi:hypothetical protein
MTTVGRWSPNKVRARVLDGTWVSTEELGGMVLLTPTSIAYTGTSATIGANGSIEFTACSSLSLNGVFSADYDNYMIVMDNVGTIVSSLTGRLRAGGIDNTTASSYTAQYLYVYGTVVAANSSTNNVWPYFADATPTGDGIQYFLFGPNLAQPTAMRFVSVSGYQNAVVNDGVGTHNQSTSYDGLTFIPAAGNISGLVSVYGLVGA